MFCYGLTRSVFNANAPPDAQSVELSRLLLTGRASRKPGAALSYPGKMEVPVYFEQFLYREKEHQRKVQAHRRYTSTREVARGQTQPQERD